MPAIVENCRSSGVATADAMVSGLAPGRLAATWMTGKSTLGTVRHHPLTRLHSLPDHGDRSVGEGNHHGAGLDGRVGLDDEDVLPLLAALYRLRGHHDRIGLGAQPEGDRGELAGPERIVRVLEGGLELDGPGGHIHGVVDEAETAPRGDRLPLRGRLDRERSPGALGLDLIEKALGHREDHVDGMNAIDHDQRIADVVGLDHIALVNEQVARAPLDGRANTGVAQLHLGVLHHGGIRLNEGLGVGHRSAVGIHRGHRGFVGGHDLIVLLARDQPALDELLVALLLDGGVVRLRLVARQVGFGLGDGGLVLGHGRLGLLERRLERTGIDDEEEIARFDVVPLLEANLKDLPAQQRIHRHRGGGLDIADALDLDGHVAGLYRGGGDRHRRRARSLGAGLFALPARAGGRSERRHGHGEHETPSPCHRRASATCR